jgi:hypothetical protein
MEGLNSLLKAARPILPRLVGLMTPELRDSLARELVSLSRKAGQTDNPIDDVVVGLIIYTLGFNPSE